MKKLTKALIIPMIYIALGIILFGNQDLMIVIFISISTVIYSYLIDMKKGFITNFLEINTIFILLFIIGLFFKDASIEIIRNYLLLVILSFTVIFLIKKRNVVII